jgi:hypothetical protein
LWKGIRQHRGKVGLSGDNSGRVTRSFMVYTAPNELLYKLVI